MKCPGCGTNIENGARFCGVCGRNLAPPAAGPGASSGQGGMSAQGQKAAPLKYAPAPHLAVKQPADPYIGKVLNNRFKVETKLGEGGFGAVYRGTQIGINRKVALKLLHPEMARDQNLVARFRREGTVSCSLRDAHTITTYDFDQTPDGTLYIAMELLEGKSLHTVFHDESPIHWQRMFKIASEMCSSLSEAHQMGIVHRDLKPENIYLEDRPGNDEFVKILDFGIAKIVRGDGSSGNQSPQLTATGQTLGTLEYMSPEQLMGKELDGRSDVYAVGVLCYELITGRLPFPDAVGPAALISAQLRKIPDLPSMAHPAGGIPDGVDRVILRCLEKDRNKRFKDVDELRHACEQLLASGGVAPSMAGGGTPLAQASTPMPMPPMGPMAQATPPPQAMRTPTPIAPAPAQLSPASPTHVPHLSAPQPYMHAPMTPHPQAPHLPLPDGMDPRRPSWAPQAVFNQGADSTDLTQRSPGGINKLWLWIAIAIVVVGGAVGAILAFR